MLIDTHAHLNAPEFQADALDALDRATAAGVACVICVGYDVSTSRGAVALAERDSRVFATVGVHPNYVAEASSGWQRDIERLCRHPRVVAIGETGLDYYRQNTPWEEQKESLAWHLALADEAGLPVVLHNRDADADLAALAVGWSASRHSASPPGVLHCFTGSHWMMETCVAAGFAVSFSGMVTFPNRSLASLADRAREAPDAALLVETDSPFLAPVPHRGRRNEPAFVRAVAERLAHLRAVPVIRIDEVTTENARRVFCLLGEIGVGQTSR